MYLNLLREIQQKGYHVQLNNICLDRWAVTICGNDNQTYFRGNTPEEAIRLAYLDMNPIPTLQETLDLERGER